MKDVDNLQWILDDHEQNGSLSLLSAGWSRLPCLWKRRDTLDGCTVRLLSISDTHPPAPAQAGRTSKFATPALSLARSLALGRTKQSWSRHLRPSLSLPAYMEGRIGEGMDAAVTAIVVACTHLVRSVARQKGARWMRLREICGDTRARKGERQTDSLDSPLLHSEFSPPLGGPSG